MYGTILLTWFTISSSITNHHKSPFSFNFFFLIWRFIHSDCIFLLLQSHFFFYNFWDFFHYLIVFLIIIFFIYEVLLRALVKTSDRVYLHSSIYPKNNTFPLSFLFLVLPKQNYFFWNLCDIFQCSYHLFDLSIVQLIQVIQFI